MAAWTQFHVLPEFEIQTSHVFESKGYAAAPSFDGAAEFYIELKMEDLFAFFGDVEHQRFATCTLSANQITKPDNPQNTIPDEQNFLHRNSYRSNTRRGLGSLIMN
jgi:hypothetical protein